MNKFLISSKKNSRLVSLLYAIYAIKYTIKKIILYMEWIENTRYDETLKNQNIKIYKPKRKQSCC